MALSYATAPLPPPVPLSHTIDTPLARQYVARMCTVMSDHDVDTYIDTVLDSFHVAESQHTAALYTVLTTCGATTFRDVLHTIIMLPPVFNDSVDDFYRFVIEHPAISVSVAADLTFKG